MRRFLLLIPAAAALALAGGFTTGRAHAEEQPTGIRVRGQAAIAAPPDVALLGIGATARRPTAGEAFARVEELVTALTASLKANGVADRDIQTRQFSLGPEYGRSTGDAPPPILGWRATHTLTVKLRDFAAIGKTIDDAVRVLGDEAVLQGIQFAIEDTDALASRARALAIEDARQKAGEIAAGAGVRAGRLLFIQEISSPPPTPTRNAAAPQTAVAAPAPAGGQAFSVDISPGELTITVIVEAIYAIE
jgi:uncharacterized protein YggE